MRFRSQLAWLITSGVTRARGFCFRFSTATDDVFPPNRTFGEALNGETQQTQEQVMCKHTNLARRLGMV